MSALPFSAVTAVQFMFKFRWVGFNTPGMVTPLRTVWSADESREHSGYQHGIWISRPIYYSV